MTVILIYRKVLVYWQPSEESHQVAAYIAFKIVQKTIIVNEYVFFYLV